MKLLTYTDQMSHNYSPDDTDSNEQERHQL